MRRAIAIAGALILAVAMPPSAAQAGPRHEPQRRPVIFVHGFSGSGLQFQTQAKRLASNGYPAAIIETHDYDSTFATESPEAVLDRLDARIARLLARTGADRVDLLGHSLGTAMSQSYLASPARAATVAHYVNLDGRTATAPPGGVATLAVWGEGDPARAITGARNVYLPDQAHTQVVTSPETFVEMFTFFTGRAPRTNRIVRQPFGAELSGRAVLFPTNVGVTDARLEIYEVGAVTGQRRRSVPDATFALAGDGSWGPFRARGGARYEFAIVRAGAATHHLYFQPFLRTDRLVMLLTSLPGTGLGALTEVSEEHTNLVISRNKEWWGDQGDAGDRLWINGRDVLNAANSPRAKRVIGIFVYDRGVDGVTDLTAPIPAFFSQPFITGLDVFIPAAPRNLGLAFVVTRSRTGGLDALIVPSWPSKDHRITLQFNDH
jgi:pimeloyl-ACP methyl ester carboxylesterase